jgi:hypothetical protein
LYRSQGLVPPFFLTTFAGLYETVENFRAESRARAALLVPFAATAYRDAPFPHNQGE